jgi:hypothetical protein
MTMAKRPFAEAFPTAEALSRQTVLTVFDLLEREHIPVTVAAANLGLSWETLLSRLNTATLLVTDLEALAAMVDTRVSDILRTAEAALLDRLLIDNA